MKEITSKLTKKVQIISDEVWEKVIALGLKNKYTVKDIIEEKLKDTPIEIKKHGKNS
ncbi:MAG: hypothetical protein IMZ64_09340 [Bacteroidetes bacterium]|nr:hypothetical protein [Bacteroidota bacterium]